MPLDDYSTSTGGGGKLKLKGSKVGGDRDEDRAKSEDKGSLSADATPEPGSGSGSGSVGKTEAERKYEEMRKKRMHERLQRDGVKTHKERVEELNKYLSRLSEHHDMPKIGPG
ncbi:hypothetical protein N7466_011598 [Penicillium verhagenii]|uniref:uncharacterized protein n=1 Tax=Penicillium verhagenii TaxID=1562060 RepID=UPI002544E180|nr:uncharacterized protein N7466_011598 [Penicillium verhagenii]KAJ5915665.1 hypothetical protein N7466_011598 [Penicillium verhagenii]